MIWLYYYRDVLLVVDFWERVVKDNDRRLIEIIRGFKVLDVSVVMVDCWVYRGDYDLFWRWSGFIY